MKEVLLTEETILKVYPQAETNVVEFINKFKDEYQINTPKRLSAFLAFIMEESWGFRKYTETLNITPIRLQQLYPALFKNINKANEILAKGEQEVANFLFNGKYGNDEQGNDGWRYKGRGLIKVRGKAEYKALSNYTGLDLVENSSLLAHPETAVKAAMAWWLNNGCNLLADKLVLNSSLNALFKQTANYSSSPTFVLLCERLNQTGFKKRTQDVGLFFDGFLKQFI